MLLILCDINMCQHLKSIIKKIQFYMLDRQTKKEIFIQQHFIKKTMHGGSHGLESHPTDACC